MLGKRCKQLENKLIRSKVMQKLPHGVRKTAGVVYVDDVSTVECDEVRIGPSGCHLLDVGLRSKLALLPSDQ